MGRPSHYGKWGQRGKFEQERVPPKHCRWCGDPITAKRRTSYCSAECADECTLRIVWGVLRAFIIKRDGLCKLCEGVSYKPNATDVWMYDRAYNLDRWRPQGGAGPFIRVEPEWHVDHILPVIEGGTDDPANLRLLCGRCHKRITAEWHGRRASERRGQSMLVLR